MSEEKFEWTKALRDEFNAHMKDVWYNYMKLDYQSGIEPDTLNHLEKFKQSKLNSNKDWEIMSVFYGEDGWTCDKKMFDWYLKNGGYIQQVKRLTDGEVFTIDDDTQYGKIKKFISHGNDISVVIVTDSGDYLYSLKYIQKVVQPNKDWEIVSFVTTWQHNHGSVEYSPKEIKSVKRLSDGEIFSVGDKVYYYSNPKQVWAIDNFYIGENKKCLARSKNDDIVEVVDDTLKKAKQPLFKTEDGVDIYEGDVCFWINTSYESYWSINEIKIKKQDSYETYSTKYFSTEQAAKDYIIMNAPHLSINDIKNASVNAGSSADIMCYVYTDELKKLVEKKINAKYAKNHTLRTGRDKQT